MRLALLVLAAAALTGCSTMTWKAEGPETPDTVAGRTQADQQRANAEARCGPTGEVSQRAGTDGSRGGDWNCERRKP